MQKFIYIVKSGTLNTTKNEFNLSPYYVSSLKKANELKERILSDNKAENKTEPFKNMYNSLINAVDYIGENGKYTARILIEKERIF